MLCGVERQKTTKIEPSKCKERKMNHEEMFADAVRLAYETFDDPSDGHITGVYAWLVWCAQRGVQADGVTVH